MLGAVADCLKGSHGLGFSPGLLSGVGVAVESGEIAAGDFQADSVTLQEYVAGGHQVDCVLVNLPRLNEVSLFRGFSVPGSNDAVGKIPGAAAGTHVH